MRTTTGWQGGDGTTALRQVPIERRDLRDDDIALRVDYCGVCHSDLHQLHRMTSPVVPGHEFTGTVVAVGPGVTAFAVGDRVAVGTIVDSCGECDMCAAGQENFCRAAVYTYLGKDRIDGTITEGGYSREYVVRDKFAYALPEGLDPAAAAPLLCAGVTVWEPLRAYGIGPGSRVAVAGLGGLGHLAVKLAVALGAEVTVLSRTPSKSPDALALGATALVDAADATGPFDLILDTISAEHDLAPLINLLALDGTLSVLGFFGTLPVNFMSLFFGRKKVAGSATGGTKYTADLLRFCAEKNITADVEVLPSSRVTEALDRLEKNDVRYRFVLDMSDLS